jgi:molecular chaperone DnaJ
MYMPKLAQQLSENNKETHYSILGISNTASKDEIKKAYRKLSLENHPDRTNGNIEKAEIYKKINEAYRILSNDNERKKYDISFQFNLENMFMGGMGLGNMGGMGLGNMGGMGLGNMAAMGLGNMGGMGLGKMGGMAIDPNVLMSMMIDPVDLETILNDINHLGIQTPFGKMSINPLNKLEPLNKEFSQHQYNSKPKTITKVLNISLLEAYTGCKVPININRWKIENNIKQEQTETIYIDVPKGIDNNEIITVNNKGNCISDTNKGDIEIKINIDNNTNFVRNGIDLIFKKSITLKESFCGFNFDLPYIDGREFKINNEAGNVIPPDFRKIIPKLGIQRDTDIGNLIIIFDIKYPKQLTTKQIEKLKEIL